MLLIDVGNSRLKWALVSNGQKIEQQSFSSHDGKPMLEPLNAIPIASTPKKILVSNVASSAWKNLIDNWAKETFSLAPEFLISEAEKLGLRNGYHSPKTLGVDRWLALLGAYQSYKVPFCVIDAGSAITLDLVNSDGQHVGGSILPGQQQLHDLLPTFSAKPINLKQHVWGQTTEDCLRTGTVKEVQALIQELASALEKDEISLILTGGGAAALEYLPKNRLIDQDLVFKGMLTYL